ncbi:hypothetical protein [Shinella sp. M27]|uniref:hypothetical protein n=1 Tax=Shinella sp. M27 TaxID=3368614 RepID=UPI003B9EBE2F
MFPADGGGARLLPGANAVLYGWIWRFWAQPVMASWAGLMMIVPSGIGMIFDILSPLLVDVGWSFDVVGFTHRERGLLFDACDHCRGPGVPCRLAGDLSFSPGAGRAGLDQAPASNRTDGFKKHRADKSPKSKNPIVKASEWV